MKTRLKVKGHLRSYMRFNIYLGFLLLALNAAIFLVSIQAGALLSAFTIFYFAVTLTLYYNNKPMIMNELVSFATEYGQIQRKLLRELDSVSAEWTSQSKRQRNTKKESINMMLTNSR